MLQFQLVCYLVWAVFLVFKFVELKKFGCSWKEYLAYKGITGVKKVLYTYFYWPVAIIIALRKKK